MNSKQPCNDDCTALANYLAASLLGIVFFPVLVFIIELFAQMTGEVKWQLPVIAGALVPLICLLFLKGQNWWVKIASVFLLACIVLKSLVLAGMFYDNTSDSMAYHGDAILLLLHGNNPIYEWMHGFDDIWTNHYPKATWYFASLIIHFIGKYNVGKSYNLILICAVTAYVFSFLRQRGLGIGNALLVAAAAGMNPVAISQIHTFYVDGALASLTTLALFSAMAMLANPRLIDKAVFILASCLLINVKFTGAAFIFMIGAVSVIVMAYRWKKGRDSCAQARELAAPFIMVALVGGALMGYNPYITNYLADGNPLYPLFGAGSTDVVAAQSPKSFNENHTSIVGKLLLSIFSRSENVIYRHGTAEPILKVPFSVTDDELSVFQYHDVRISGWGVLFGGILLLSAALYFSSAAWKDSEISIGLAFTLFTVLINPGSWWARYAPEVALLPLLMAIPPLSAKPWQRITAKFIFALLILNSALIISPNLRYFRNATETMDAEITDMLITCGKGVYEISDTGNYHYEQFLMDKGISIVYPERDILKTHPKNELFPLQDVYLYKEGCVRK